MMGNICLCGCGRETKLDSSKYISGHYKRGKTKENSEHIRKQSESLKEYFKENKHHNDKRVELICPFCNKEFIAHRWNQFCSVSCRANHFWKDEKYREKQGESLRKYFEENDVWNKGMKGIYHIWENKDAPMKGRENKWGNHTEETKKKIGDLGRGREKTEEELLKLRNSQIKYVEEVRMKGGILYPCIGRYEKRIIDIFENVTGYTFIRQFKTHGFFIDGYCSMLKLAIEVDETYHNNQIEKDIKRQEYLEREIGCSFIRINVGDKK